jgi:hypothetical protein
MAANLKETAKFNEIGFKGRIISNGAKRRWEDI